MAGVGGDRPSASVTTHRHRSGGRHKPPQTPRPTTKREPRQKEGTAQAPHAPQPPFKGKPDDQTRATAGGGGRHKPPKRHARRPNERRKPPRAAKPLHRRRKPPRAAKPFFLRLSRSPALRRGKVRVIDIVVIGEFFRGSLLFARVTAKPCLLQRAFFVL